jgi:hypothetical protein
MGLIVGAISLVASVLFASPILAESYEQNIVNSVMERAILPPSAEILEMPCSTFREVAMGQRWTSEQSQGLFTGLSLYIDRAATLGLISLAYESLSKGEVDVLPESFLSAFTTICTSMPDHKTGDVANTALSLQIDSLSEENRREWQRYRDMFIGR